MGRLGTAHDRRANPKNALGLTAFLRRLQGTRWLLGVSLPLWLGSAALVAETGAQARELVDRIVAEVNGVPILFSEVKEKVEKGPLVMVSEYPASDKDDAFTRALQDSINYELVMSKIDELEIEVSDAQVEEQVKQILDQNRLDKAGLLEFLRQQGKTYAEYKDDIRKQMLFMRFRGQVLMPLVKITDKDVESYYLKKSGSTAEAINLYLRQILIKIPKDTPAQVKAEKEKLAKEVQKKLEAGADFVEVEKIYSDLPDAREGRPANAFKLADLNSAIRDAVANLGEKEASKPITTAAGVHFFYLEQRKFTGSREFEENKRQFEFDLRQQEMMEQLRRWLKDARKNNDYKMIPE